MANTIKLKRGTSTPSTSDIVSGEVAVDTSAKKLYINDSGTVKEIGGGGVSSDAQNNTVGGTGAGDSFTGTSAEKNTLFGKDAGTTISTGDNNTAFGMGAMAGYKNGAGTAVTGDENVAIGYWNMGALSSGKGNIGIGSFAGS